jgi:hypothetical protein
VFDDGGMLLDLAIGGQKFIFRTAALGRARTTEGALEEGTAPESSQQPQGEREPVETQQAQGNGEPKPSRK